MLRAFVTLCLFWSVAACSSTASPQGNPTPTPDVPSASAPLTGTPSSTPDPTVEPTPQPTLEPAPETTPEPTPPTPPLLGIDVSHHQGSIDWAAVSRDRVDFAYLKATEGRTFTDPRFAANSRAADSAGLRVGAYHYFSLCSAGGEQGQHFAATMAAQTDAGVRLALPPAVDLELLGSCTGPPAREELLAEVRAFLEVVEQATGQRVVVYSFPDFEERYGFADDLDRRQWVRRLGDQPPGRKWWLWQRSQTASVSGVDGPVDLNVLRSRG
ncbi:hypothetical protein GCM10027020_30070 [Nocardioides salsibiostraticola]